MLAEFLGWEGESFHLLPGLGAFRGTHMQWGHDTEKPGRGWECELATDEPLACPALQGWALPLPPLLLEMTEEVSRFPC